MNELVSVSPDERKEWKTADGLRRLKNEPRDDA